MTKINVLNILKKQRESFIFNIINGIDKSNPWLIIKWVEKYF